MTKSGYITKAGRMDGKALFGWSSMLLAFCMPLLSRGLMAPIILWLIAWFFVPKQSIRQQWKPILVFTGLYLFHLIGMLYTDNIGRGFNDLEQKLSLLAFPLLLGVVPAKALPKRQDVLGAFAAGTIGAVIVSFVTAYADYQETGLVQEFYYSRFSHVHHPSYLSLYINFSLAALFAFVLSKWTTARNGFFMFLPMALLASSLVFVSSKMGFIQFAVLMPFALLMAYQKAQLKAFGTMYIVLTGLLFAMVLWYNPLANERIAIAVEVVSDPERAMAQGEAETNTARLHSWKLTFQEILKHPFGVGTGDVHDVLMRRYREEGLSSLAEKGLNPHNNYLQIGLALGVPALLWFFFSLAYPVGSIWRRRDWLYGFFLVSMVMHMTVESMLEKQSGVVFFAFFNALFYFGMGRHENSLKPDR